MRTNKERPSFISSPKTLDELIYNATSQGEVKCVIPHLYPKAKWRFPSTPEWRGVTVVVTNEETKVTSSANYVNDNRGIWILSDYPTGS